MDKTLILIVAAALVTTVAAQDPEIVDEIWPEVKPVGRTARLNCTVANKLSHVVTWEHMDTYQVISLDETIDLSYNPIEGGKRKYEVQMRGPENRITYMLIIRRLRQQDAGRYRCCVRIQGLDYTKWPSKRGSLTVQVAAQDPEIVDEIWPEVKPVGRTARLNCTVANKLSHVVTWEHTDTYQVISIDETIDLSYNPIEGGKRKYEVQTRGPENRITYMLIIRRLRQQDAGRYRCCVRIKGLDYTKWPIKRGSLTVQETTECQGPNCPLPSSKATEVKVSLLSMAVTALVSYIAIASDRR